MRKIAIEEHFTTQTYQEYLQKLAAREGAAALGQLPPPIETKLLDLGEERLRLMDEAGIDVQVLSLTPPGLERVPASDARILAQDINDELADRIRQQPTRFAGF